MINHIVAKHCQGRQSFLSTGPSYLSTEEGYKLY